MNTPRILTAGIATLLALPIAARAMDYHWTANPGNNTWSDASNWDANGVPVSNGGNRIFVHTSGSFNILGPVLDAGLMILAIGNSGAPTSGYTFGAGTYNVGTLYIGENKNANIDAIALNNGYGRAFINAGTTINVNAFHLGEWDGASGHVIQTGGDVNISGQFRLGHWPQAGGASNDYTMSGGTITMTGAAGDGSEGSVGSFILGVDSSGTFNMNGGTITAHGITMQTRGAGGGESFFKMNGGQLNLGVNGFKTSNPGTLNSYDIQLGGGTVRSTAAWNSDLEMHLMTGGTGIIFDSNGFNTTLSGAVNGGGGLTKNGNGTLAISNAGSFVTGATVNGGVLNVSGQNGGDGGIRGTVTVNYNAELRATGTGGAIFGYNNGTKLDVLNINGGLVNSVGGINHIWNAAVNMTGGELKVNGGVSSATGDRYEWGNTTLTTFASTTTATISGRINVRADANSRFVANVADGAATTDLLISAAMTESGGGANIYKIGAGTMELTGGAAASGSIQAVGGVLTLSGSGTYTTGYLGIGLNDVLNGVPGSGGGTLNIKDTVVITTGTMSMGENNGGAFQTNTVNQTGGSVTITGNSGEGAGFRLGHWPSNTSTYNLSAGSLSMTDPNGGLAIATDGTGLFIQTGGTLNVPVVYVNHRNGGGDATFTVQGGTANIGAGGIVTAGGPAAFNLGGSGGTLAATAAWSSSLNAVLSGTGANAIHFNTTGGNIAMTGVLSGGGGLTKNGNGTLTLSGTNTYTGATAVSAGTLLLPAAGSAAGSDIAVQNGGTLHIATTGKTLASLTIEGGSAFTLPAITASTTTLTGALTFTSSPNFTVRLLLGGPVTVNQTFDLLTAGSVAGTAGTITTDFGLSHASGHTTVVGNILQLTIDTAGAVLTWNNGASTGNWVTNADANFTGADGKFLSNDSVIFTNTAAGTVTLIGSLAPADVTVNSTADYVFTGAGSITTGSLTKSGSSKLTLATANSYGGVTTINAGTVQLGDGVNATGSFGIGAVTNNAAVITDFGANTVTLATVIGGTGTLTKNGSGIVKITGTNTFSGTTTISAGTLQLGDGGSTGSVGGGIVDNAALVADFGGNTATIANAISGSGSLTKNGNGTVYLTGANTYGGGTTINSGNLVIGNGGVTGALGTGTTILSSTLIFAKTSASTIDGDVNPGGPAGRLILIADGAVTLASGTDVKVNSLETGINGQNDTLGGTLNIGPGTSLVVQNNFTFGNTLGGGALSHGIVNQTGGTVDVNAPNTDGRNFVLGHWNQGRGTYNLSAGTLSSPNISMAVSWDGDGTFVLSGSGIANVLGLRFGHNGGRTGVFNLTGGTLNLGAEGIWEQNAGLPNDINLGGGIVRAAVNTNIYLPTELTGTNGDVTFDTNGNTLTVTGAMTGAGGFTKAGAGTMVLAAPNSAGGIFTVNAGTLRVSADAALGGASSLIQINNNATLQAGGTFAATARTVSLGAGGGTIDTQGNSVTFGAGNAIGGTVLTKIGTGTLTLAGTQAYATLNANEGVTNVNSAIGTGTSIVNANATVNFGTSQTLGALNIADGVEVTFGDGSPFAGGPGKFGGAVLVPEPGVLGLLVVGAVGVLSRRRRK